MRNRRLALIGLLLGACLGLYGFNSWNNDHLLFINADIVTLDESLPVAQAMEISGGRIEFVGSSKEVLARQRWNSRITDFQGRTLLPGFVDAHSHFLATGLSAVTVDLNPPPAGTVSSLDDLYQRVAEEIEKTGPGNWIIGFNYDNTAYPSGQHPDRRRLDALSDQHRIYLRHNSGHMGVANSAALTELLATQDWQLATSSADNSRFIGRYRETGEPNGLLQETAAPSMARFIRQFSLPDYVDIVQTAEHNYLSQGYTTVQNGLTGKAELFLLRWLSRLGLLSLRLSVWPAHKALEAELAQGDLTPLSLETDKFHVSAVKLIADGSPQGYTAFLSKPYHVTPVNKPKFRGHGEYSANDMQSLLQHYFRLGWPVAVHTNGDAAVDDVLNALAEIESSAALAASGVESIVDRPRPKVILVHAQTIRPDQLLRLKKLRVTPSYFPAHTYYWGDWHREKTLGPRRAAFISPMKSTEILGIRYSIHTDAPVTRTSSMLLLWSATERETLSGQVLGDAERISRQSALRAMTIDAAWQNGLHDTVGSLQVGKFADVVELSENPLAVDDVRQVEILRTFVGGDEVFRLSP